MGGQLFGGNELLAKGYFTRNGKKQEAATGVLAQTSSFTASDNRSRVLIASALDVANIQAGTSYI
ncbi:MAG: hypothetical protein Q4A60_07105 [Pasteurellaceae bacterium]|nr:hypothetical protein [Pasteurellaceae bacterium]